MKKHKFFLYALLLPLLAVQCNKFNEDDGLPPITTEGKNTFGCRVNGEVWIPAMEFNIFVGKLDVFYYKSTGRLGISANRRIDELGISQSILFSGRGIYHIGEHSYHITDYSNFDTSFCINHAFEIDTTAYSQLEILRLDTGNRIISGTFEYTATNDECGQVVITDGRFDLTY